MDSSTRHLFAQQLGHWAQAAILNGRSPFRKVETGARILTAQGSEQPPLIFWVNRESCMAGGLVFFPGTDAPPDLSVGEGCARALGLRHFVTWGAREVVFWETTPQAPTPLRSLPLPADALESPAIQHDLLLRVLDELKLLAVLGTVPPAQLDPDYLANLCYGTLETVLPPLSEAFRLARGEHPLDMDTLPPEALAWGKGILVLVRLLTLLLHDRLPLSLQPEGLERAILFALDTLPEQLASYLRPSEEEVPLPPEGAIRFHHLFRRLNQLRPAIDRPRAGQALTTLARAVAPTLGVHPLPFASPRPDCTLWLIHGDPELAPAPEALCATPAWLALQLLRRHLQNLSAIPWQGSDLFTLGRTSPPTLVAGTLTEQQAAPAARRQFITTQLRNSWPNRRFALNAGCPIWFLECLHLLGLTAENGVVELSLPATWLSADYGLLLHELLCEQFTLDRLEEQGSSLRMRALKTLDPGHPLQLLGPAGPRSLSWGELSQQHRGFLRLALAAPEPLWQLLQRGQLRCFQGSSAPADRNQALWLYSRSTLARQLWATLSNGLPLPAAANLTSALGRFGLPVPGPEVLDALLGLTSDTPGTLPAAKTIDRELGRWLGIDLAKLKLPACTPRRRPTPARKGAEREQLAEQILAAATQDGIPQFPEHYLYDHYRPKLQLYHFAGTLQHCGEFFGRHTLQDGAGRSLEVEGSETLRALLLASSLGRSPVALPIDRELTANILVRYCNDLRHLRQSLVRLAHINSNDPSLADQLVEQLWKSLPVPAWELIGG